MTRLYDVLAVDLLSNHVRVIASGKSLDNAEAIVRLAVMRRGVEDEFFVEVPAGKYLEGDVWAGR